jgi:Helitron helicase-like domain at N-terminus
MNDSGLASTVHAPLPWPAIGPAFSEYTTDGLFSMAFPTLFPLGLADISLRRHRKIELHEWAKHLMRYRDSRFATHPRFRFFALNLIFQHRSMQRGKYLFSRNISHHSMTVGQLKEALSRHDGPHLAADIVRCLKTVKATRPYWNMEGGKLRDMIAQIGTPTFFYTLSMADMSWPDLHKLMPDNPFAPGLTPTQSSQIRFHNVATNPHIIANYLSTKHRHLLDTVLQHLDLEDNAHVLDFWYRFEWQARGSGDT